MMLKKLGLLAFMSMLCLLFAANGFAVTCETEYTWKCADKQPNQCLGYFHGVHGAGAIESFQEPNPDLQCGDQQPGHSLRQILRFENLPSFGAHKLKMSYASQNVCGAAEETEVMRVSKRVVDGCEDTGPFQQVVDVGPEGSSETEYALGVSGTTQDICLEFKSPETNVYRDEFYTFHQADHAHPIIVTDADYEASSEATGVGSVVSGSYQSTFVSDNVREQLREGGIQHRLLHVYTIKQVPSTTPQTLRVEGYRPNNLDGDNFAILYQWISSGSCPTSGPYQTSGIVINSGTETAYSANVGNSSGILCVAVDDTTGGSHNDSVYIDRLYLDVGTCP